jgi:putative ABC transport system permease protein
MLKISWSNFKAHIGRLLASMVAIALGVAFVVGIMGFASAIKSALITSLASQDQNISVIVTPKVGGQFNDFNNKRTIPYATLGEISSISNVKAIYGQISGPSVILDSHNKPFGTSGIGVSAPSSSAFKMYPLAEGNYPVTNSQVDVDQFSFNVLKLSIGSHIKIVSNSGTPQTFKVVGVIVPPATRTFNSGSFTLFTASEAAAFTGASGYSRIDVLASSSVSDSQLKTQVIDKIGNGYNVMTGAEAVSADESKIITATSTIQTALLIFAVVAIFVASLVIVNTFRVLVAQRIRQLALLRCIGASKRQIFKLLVYESTLTGFVASLIGIVFGFGVTDAIVKAIAFRSPALKTLGVSITIGPILYGLAVGILVTVAASMLPIIKATKVAPVEALRIVGESRITTKTSAVRLTIMAVFYALGLLIILGGLHGSNAALIVTIGGALIFVGVIVSMPFLVKPIINVLSFPLKLFGTVTKIGRANTFRNRNRTATTSSALTIGLMLVSLVAVIFYSFSSSITSQLTKDVPFSYIVSTGRFHSDVPVSLVDKFNRSKLFNGVYTEEDEPAAVQVISYGSIIPGSLKFRRAQLQPAVSSTASISNELFKVYGLKNLYGTFQSYNSGEVIVSKSVANALGIGVGAVLSFTSNSGTTIKATVGAIMANQNIISNIIIPQSTMSLLYPTNGYSFVFLNQAYGANTQQTATYIQNLLDSYPLVSSENLQSFISNITSKIAIALDIFTALLGFALLIAFIGIANTLSLSVIERTQEFGLLRALGFTRAQIKMTLVFEGLMTSLLGSIVGIVLGVIGGYGVVKSISSSGIILFVIPWSNLVIYLVIAAVAGILASLLPARRASRLAPTEAMAQIG